MEANIITNKGTISLKLFDEKAPITVANFANLAKKEYYNNLTFHRVIDNFMIQGGCPNGTGMGGPGYNFKDEFHSELKHDKPGILSMANAGPGTNGSQFFITHLETPWLDNNHTVFGEFNDEKSMEIVNSICQNDHIEKIEIKGEVKNIELVQDYIDSWNAVLDK